MVKDKKDVEEGDREEGSDNKVTNHQSLTIFIFLTIIRPSLNPRSSDAFQKRQSLREDWLLVDKKQGSLSPKPTVTPHPGPSLSN